MLSLAAGHDIGYVLKAVAAGREGYYSAAVSAGEPPGRWHGAGAERLGLRGVADNDVVEAVYSRLMDPRDEGSTLGKPHRAYRSAEEIYQARLAEHPDAGPEERARIRAAADRAARQAVALFDATFNAPKSVTVLGTALERMENESRAAGDEAQAAAWATQRGAVEDSLHAGADAALDYLYRVAGYTRAGNTAGAGGRWVPTQGWVVCGFFQHDSRDHDPHWHRHNPILNRVQDTDGQWRGLDGKALFLHRGAASEIGLRTMEAHLAKTLGIRFETRPDGVFREIVGIDADVMEMFSSRRRAIAPKAKELIDQFRAQFGREPTAFEQKRLKQQATLLTRKAKTYDGETAEERLARWEAETRAVVAGGLRQVAMDALRADPRADEPARWSPEDVIARALADVESRHTTWTRPRLIRAVSEALPARLGVDPDQIPDLLERLADEALERAVQIDPDPVGDDMVDGLVTVRPGSLRYATEDQIAAEQRLRDLAVERIDARCSAEDADKVVDTLAAAGLRLGADQAAVVRGVLSDGAQVHVLTAPAGSGKSVVVGAVAEGWRRHGGRVRGLAPSQVAAQVLSAEGVDSLNLAAWRTALRSGRERVAAGDLLVVDEAGMAATQDLLDVVERGRAAGATVLVVGDPAQLGAVGPGGALADLAERAEHHELVEVRRFHDGWEAEASLRLRDGDLDALADYDRHGRILAGGTVEQAEQRAARSWLADTLNGRESLLVVGSNEAAARVSGELRAKLVHFGRVREDGVHLGRDGNTAGVGDLVQARRNDWTLDGRPVNRATYRVVEVLDDGGLRVEPAAGGEAVELPAAYVAEDLTLAYASTVHSAQGRTVDTTHAVLGGGMDASTAYVALTRGRERNTAHVVTVATPQDSPVGEASTVEPRSARAILADSIEASEPERTALAEQEVAEAEQRSVLWNVERLAARAAEATAGRVGRWLDRMTIDGVLSEEQRTQLAIDSSTGALERLLRTVELAGHDPEQVMRDIASSHSLRGARSVAQVLHHRIRESDLDLAPLVTSAQDLIPRSGIRDDDYRELLIEHAERLDQRRHELGAELAAEPPRWLTSLIGPPPEDAMARVEWEERAGWAAAAREATGHDDETLALGVAPPPGVSEKHALWRVAQSQVDPDGIGREETLLSDGALRVRMAAAERERVWAPRHVADELAATEERARARREDAVLWSAHADRLGDPEDVARLRADAEQARLEAEALDERIVDLRAADSVWERWLAETATTRELAERARVELTDRGVDLDANEARVTAQEWLAAHAAAVEVEEQTREITDADIADDLHSGPPNVSDRVADGHPLVEKAVPDIRETAEPDETRHTDTGRRVPTVEETADAVARAREALAEILARDTLEEPDLLADAALAGAQDVDDDVDELVDSS